MDFGRNLQKNVRMTLLYQHSDPIFPIYFMPDRSDPSTSAKYQISHTLIKFGPMLAPKVDAV